MHSHLPPKQLAAQTLDALLDRSNSDVVLIVDDVPDNLGVLHDALDESGFSVLVATDGASALQRAEQARPDVILLDAVMPGMDGFEVARQLKANPATAAIPILFMTGLTDTDYLVAALECGAVDYVTKPLKPKEVLARMAVHLAGARERRQARSALDAFGYASMTVQPADGRILWQTPLARILLERYGGTGTVHLAPAILQWLQQCVRSLPQDPAPLTLEHGTGRLVLRLHPQDAQGDSAGDWMIVMREVSDQAALEVLTVAFKLTPREADVLYWVIKGKTNKDIGDILGSSPMTVKKHLERVYVKLGVETRTAAAGMAVGRLRQLYPPFEP